MSASSRPPAPPATASPATRWPHLQRLDPGHARPRPLAPRPLPGRGRPLVRRRRRGVHPTMRRGHLKGAFIRHRLPHPVVAAFTGGEAYGDASRRVARRRSCRRDPTALLLTGNREQRPVALTPTPVANALRPGRPWGDTRPRRSSSSAPSRRAAARSAGPFARLRGRASLTSRRWGGRSGWPRAPPPPARRARHDLPRARRPRRRGGPARPPLCVRRHAGSPRTQQHALPLLGAAPATGPALRRAPLPTPGHAHTFVCAPDFPFD